MAEPILEIDNLSLRRGAFALADVSATLQAGEVLAVLGPSGCGKSTLIDAICGLEPSRGRVRIAGRDVSALPPHRRGVAVCLQELGLWDRLSARRNVALACAADTPDVWLDRVTFTADRDKPTSRLSGGERQRVALARALSRVAPLTMLDEPGANLDRLSNLRLGEAVSTLVRARNGALLVVGHRLDEVLRVEPDHLLVLEAGRVVRQGRPAELIRDPQTFYVASLLGYENIGSTRTREDRPQPANEGPPIESGTLHAWRFGGIRESVDGAVRAKVVGLLSTEAGPAARVETENGERFVVPATTRTLAGADVRLVFDEPVVVRG